MSDDKSAQSANLNGSSTDGAAAPTVGSSSDDRLKNLATCASNADCIKTDDNDFEPDDDLQAEMDDERTLDEEESLYQSNPEAVQSELDELRKDAEVPMENLLQLYNQMRQDAGIDDDDEYDDEEDDDYDDEDEEFSDDEDDDSDSDSEAKVQRI